MKHAPGIALAFLLLTSCSSERKQPGPPPPGHTQGVMSATFTPDGRHVISGGYDRTIREWDVATGRELRVIQANDGGVLDVAVSPDGKWLASAGHDKTVRLFEFSSGREVRRLRHLLNTRRMVFSPDSRLLISHGDENAVRVWDVETGNELRSIGTGTGMRAEFTIRQIVVTPDGRWVALVGMEPLIRLWNTETGKEGPPIRVNPDQWDFSMRAALDPAGRILTVAGSGTALLRFDIQSGRPLKTGTKLSPANYGVIDLTISPDGRWMAITRGRTVEVHDLTKPGDPRRLAGHSEFVTSVTFSPDSRSLATTSYDNTVKLWEVATGRMLRTFGSPPPPREEPD